MDVIKFTDEVVSSLFGKEAAEDEDFDRLQAYYIKGRTHERLVADLPLRILVGHKGIGKSAIFTVARHEDEKKNRLSVLIRPDDIAQLGKVENNFDQLIHDWKIGLIEIISNKICESVHLKSDSSNWKRVSYWLTQFVPLLKQFIQKKLEDSGISETDKLIMTNFMQSGRVNIYIDDLDRGWER